MDVAEMTKVLPGGPLVAIGGLLGIIAAAGVYFRQYLSGAAASRASDNGQIAALAVYQSMVEMLNKRVIESDMRADGFAKERNEAISAMGKLQGQMDAMNRQLDNQSQELVLLREQVRKLTEQLNDKP